MIIDKILFNIFLIVVLVFNTSCLGTKKCNKIVDNHLKTINYKSYNSSKTTIQASRQLDSLTSSKKTKSYFIPGIIYWAFMNEIECKLNEQNIFNYINQYLAKDIDSLIGPNFNSNNKLKITIDIDKSIFNYHAEGQLFLIFNLLKSNDSKYILSKSSEILVSIEYLKNNQPFKKTFRIENKSCLTKYKGTTNQEFIETFLDTYNDNLKSTSKSIIKLISTELN